MRQVVRRVSERQTSGVESVALTGRVARLEPNGDVLVDFPGNTLGLIRARVATSEEIEGGDAPVLLLFENGDRSLPIVVGVLRDGVGRQVKRTLTVEAAEEIIIACGKSTITLRRDGRIAIKGTELVSRASRTNKIRGASVAIN